MLYYAFISCAMGLGLKDRFHHIKKAPGEASIKFSSCTVKTIWIFANAFRFDKCISSHAPRIHLYSVWNTYKKA